MPKISKILPAFYGGISEQSNELVLDTQCRDMVNCIPDVVRGLERRNGLRYVSSSTSGLASKVFHTYDRGEGEEEYIFLQSGNPTNPLYVFDKDGNQKTVTYVGTLANYTDYFTGKLRAITVQDRTFIANTTKVIGQTTISAPSTDYTRVAYYWLSRSSNDSNAPYRYAVYLNGTIFQVTNKDSDAGATALASAINADANYTAEAIGSVVKIYRTNGADFTFDSWDSWGNQASTGWKGSIAKLSDLPRDMPWEGVIVKITGTDTNDFTDYFVKSDDGVWVETRDPSDLRGTFTNMPLYVDRLSDGTFEVGQLSWETPNIGDANTNPTPSFVGNNIQDIFFFKNRLGFASSDSVILSEEGGYYNFYAKTALNIIDTDPIDIAIASNQASKIYYAVPFQRSLYLFTKESQLELVYQGTFSPANVSVDIVTNYDMDINVPPKTSGNSLYFISATSNSRSQLREYIKDEDNLVTKGVDVTLNVPTLLPTVTKLVTSPSLGITIMYSKTDKSRLYVYRATESGGERIQSALFKWEFPVDIENIFLFDKELYITYEGDTQSHLLKLPILPDASVKVDEIDGTTTMDYISYVTLCRWYPRLGEMKTPLDNVQIKRVAIYGEGTFDVDIERVSYGVTITRTFDSLSTADMSASVAGRTDDTVLTLKSNSTEPFRIASVTLEGLYRQSSRELK